MIRLDGGAVPRSPGDRIRGLTLGHLGVVFCLAAGGSVATEARAPLVTDRLHGVMGEGPAVPAAGLM